MLRQARTWATVAILLAAGFRIWVTVEPPVKPLDDLRPVRELILADLQQAMQSPNEQNAAVNVHSTAISQQAALAGVTEISPQRFDPTALVVIRPGPDGQPGAAGVDDNADGVVDDNAELGATRSDDRCLVEPSGDRSAIRPAADSDEPKLVLQQGAFVPAAASEPPKQTGQRRAIVQGRAGNDHWSLLITLP